MRIDPSPVTTVSSQPLPGMSYPVLLAIPGASVILCTYPANGNPCTNLAQTYTDPSLATACPFRAQVVLNSTSVCTNQADAQGNFGFYVATGGTYAYEIQTPQGQTYGPYTISATSTGCPTSGCAFTGPVTSNSTLDIAGFIDTEAGYQFNHGGGTVGQCLVSNGTAFVPNSCPLPTVYYQHMYYGSTLLPQEPALQFNSSRFLINTVANTYNTIDLQTVGSGGSCTLCTVAYDSYGRVTSVSNGVVPSNGTDYYFSFTGCTITNGSNLNNCSGTVNFTSGGNTSPSFPALADSNYFPFCMVNTGNQYTASVNVGGSGLTTTGFTYYWTEIMANGSTSSSPIVYCHVHHS